MINILACASDNYTMQCGVLFLSICENNKKEVFRFFVMTDNAFQDINKKRLEDIIHSYNDNNVLEFICVDEALVSDFQSITSKFYPKEVLYRLLAADLLPSDVDKVLYLDCDIIVRHSLIDLWKIDISGFSVGCVPDALSGIVGIYNRLQYPQRFGYFNSGVLLINLVYWRSNNICEKYYEFSRTTDIKITLPDQDILNVVLHKSKLFIPITYNLQSGFLYKLSCMSYDYYGNEEELTEACVNPVILHLAGERPWYKGSKHPYKDEYYKYKNMTVWKDVPLKSISYGFKNTIKQKLRTLLCILGILSPIENPYNCNLQLVH